MALKLEDLIAKKKEPGGVILDLAKVKIRSKEEFDTHFEQIPEFKIRPEKVRYEDCKMRDTDFKFVLKKKEARRMLTLSLCKIAKTAGRKETYGDPVPLSMRSVRLEDLAAVDIHWKMLTMSRPLNKLEEDIFSRLVELGKLRVNTQRLEQKLLDEAAAAAPPGSQSTASLANIGIVVSKNKRGMTETRCRTCKECGEELCTGVLCKEFPYDAYTRLNLDKEDQDGQSDDDEDEDEKRGGGHKSRRPSKKAGANGKGGKNKKSNSLRPGGGRKLIKTKVKTKSKSPQKRVLPPHAAAEQQQQQKPLAGKLSKLRKKKVKKKSLQRRHRSSSSRKSRRGKTSDSELSDD